VPTYRHTFLWLDLLLTDEVDDEASVGVAARGAAEERHAVGEPCRWVGQRVGGEDDDVVAGVGEGVAEAEDGVILVPRPARDGGGDDGIDVRQQHHGRQYENRPREETERLHRSLQLVCQGKFDGRRERKL
jgi:hypothetical protein